MTHRFCLGAGGARWVASVLALGLVPALAQAQTVNDRDPVVGPPAIVNSTQEWRSLCTIYQCRQDYEASIGFMLRHAKGASEWLARYGFQNGWFAPSEDGRPVLRIIGQGDEDQLGAYGRSDGLIVLTERGGMVDYRRVGIESLEGPNGIPVGKGRELASTIGHEVFHGHHALLTTWDVEHVGLKWMTEGVAELAGNLYLQTLTGEYQDFRAETVNYFADLRDPLYAYERGIFFYGLATEISSGNEARVLRHFARGHGAVAGAEPWIPDAEEDGVASLDAYLRSTSLGSLRTGYGRVIARFGNVADHYVPTVEGQELAVVTRQSRYRRELNPEASSIPPFTSRGMIARVGADALRPPLEPPAYPGQELVRVAIYAAPEVSDRAIGLAVDAEWVDRAAFERILAPQGQSDIDFLARVTNIADHAVASTDATYQFGFDVTSVLIRAPNCVSIGSSIALENTNGLTLRATRGRIADGVYTAPPRAGEDVLEVEAYTSKTQKAWLAFSKVDVRATACGIRMTMAEGTITYDASTDATVIQSEGRENYITAEGYIGFDEERGVWRLISTDMIDRAAPGALGLVPFTAMGDETLPPQRLPLGYTRTLGRVVEQLKAHAPQMLSQSRGPCPGGIGQCTTYRVMADEGGVVLVYDSDDRLVRAVDDDGQVTTFEYSDFSVNPPLAVRGP